MDVTLTEERKVNIKEIFEAQRLNQGNVKAASITERKNKLRKLKSAIENSEKEILDAVQKDLRKPGHETLIWEVCLMYGEIEFALKNLSNWADDHKVPSDLLKLMNDNRIKYEPKGVALIIGPWNFPFQLIIGPLISSIAAGNCSILKPPSMTPATSNIVAKLIKETFPENEIAVIEGDSSISTELLTLPFDHIFFTGSPGIGKVVMSAAAKHLTSVTLELGGKSPVIVDETANIKKAAAKLTWGKFANAGQTCVAPDYVFVHKSKKDELIKQLKENIVSEYYVNDAINKEEYCQIISDRNFDRVQKLVDDAVENGATIEIGGKMEKADRTIHPTVLTGVSIDSQVMTEEIFGPVLPILTYDSIEEVLSHINNNDKPLALYVFSKSNKRINNVINSTTSGGVCVNDVVLQFTNPNLPFGGVGTSGMGSAHGFYGYKAFSHERAVMRQSTLVDINEAIYPPYSGVFKKFILEVYKKFV